MAGLDPAIQPFVSSIMKSSVQILPGRIETFYQLQLPTPWPALEAGLALKGGNSR
jgi:hypothetical protein